MYDTSSLLNNQLSNLAMNLPSGMSEEFTPAINNSYSKEHCQIYSKETMSGYQTIHVFTLLIASLVGNIFPHYSLC